MLLRVQLPDRPGSLGAVASAMGQVGADISAIEIVEKGDGFVIDDFMLSLPPGRLPDSLVSACTALDGVKVLYLSRHQESWGIESDIETLNRMSSDPQHSREILLEAAPTVFHCQWAAIIDAASRRCVNSTALAPEFDAAAITALDPLDAAHRADLPAGWTDGWNDTTVAVSLLLGGQALVLGRQGGPAFLDSELNRLNHLAALAH